MSTVQDNKSTRIISITNAGTNIIAHLYCRRIWVQENYDSVTPPTSDLTQKAPAGATAIKISKGTPAIFTAPGPNGAFTPGQIVGVVACTVAGPIEGQQREDQLV